MISYTYDIYSPGALLCRGFGCFSPLKVTAAFRVTFFPWSGYYH